MRPFTRVKKTIVVGGFQLSLTINEVLTCLNIPSPISCDLSRNLIGIDADRNLLKDRTNCGLDSDL